MGDFNAHVGRNINDSIDDYGVVNSNTIGPYSPKDDLTPNANDSKRWIWKHPRYRTRARLGYVGQAGFYH